jgi:ubiquinone/menaquinone biosynthesis C-methylase UbiE
MTYHDSFAHHYDALRAGDDYETWSGLLHQLIHQFGNGGARMLDVGCGTGTSSLAFARRGYHVVGCDASASMLTVARRERPEGAVAYLRADMRRLPAELVDFDVVNMMDDVVNNMLTTDDLIEAFGQARRALARRGLLVFDANTIKTYRTTFATTEVTETATAFLLWRGATNDFQPRGCAQAKVTAFTNNGTSWRREDASIAQRHHPHDDICAAIEQVGLQVLGTYGMQGNRLAQPADEDVHHKIVYVARPT